jgi:hypothetical protein
MRSKLPILALAVGAALLLGGCDMAKFNEPFNDADRAKEYSQPADVITMPDGFSNLATKCGPGGMRYTVVYHADSAYGSVNVVADVNCPK